MGHRVVAALICLISLTAVRAHADERAVARKAYREASAQYDLANYAEALRLFKKAYLSFEDPSFLYNMAQCERQLQHKQEAVTLYRSFLRNVPTAPNRADVEATIGRLEHELADEAAARERDKAAAEAAARPAPTPAVETPAAPLVVERPHRPIYKRWWLWTAVAGGAVAIGLGVGLGVGLSHRTTHFDNTLPALGPGMHTAALVRF